MAEIVFDHFSDRAWRVCRCVFFFPFRNGYGHYPRLAGRGGQAPRGIHDR